MARYAPGKQKVFDALIVGSGATGGWAAKELTEAGFEIALLEAGPKTTPDQFGEHVPPYQLKFRDARHNGVPSPEVASAASDACQARCLLGSELQVVCERH